MKLSAPALLTVGLSLSLATFSGNALAGDLPKPGTSRLTCKKMLIAQAWLGAILAVSVPAYRYSRTNIQEHLRARGISEFIELIPKAPLSGSNFLQLAGAYVHNYDASEWNGVWPYVAEQVLHKEAQIRDFYRLLSVSDQRLEGKISARMISLRVPGTLSLAPENDDYESFRKFFADGWSVADLSEQYYLQNAVRRRKLEELLSLAIEDLFEEYRAKASRSATPISAVDFFGTLSTELSN